VRIDLRTLPRASISGIPSWVEGDIEAGCSGVRRRLNGENPWSKSQLKNPAALETTSGLSGQ